MPSPVPLPPSIVVPVWLRQALVACACAKRSKTRAIDELTILARCSSDAGLDAIRVAQDRGLVDAGNPRWGWPTPEGQYLLDNCVLAGN